MSQAAEIWTALVPWLLLTWLFLVVSGRRGAVGSLVCAVAAAAVVVFPWWGHPLPYWTRALLANYSLATAGLLIVALVEKGFGRSLFRAQDWNAALVFGTVATLALYPSALGLGPGSFDSYAMGWPWLFWGQAGVLFGAMTATTVILLMRGNRFGLLMLAGLLGYAVGFQESQNFWDYMIDPIFGGISSLIVFWPLILRLRRR